ncbi:MAG: sulfatase-like hydrolase/transferase, partial [Planctomycetota bacterium]
FNHALDFIDQHNDEPFFIYLPVNTPHSPMQVPQRYWDRFEDKAITPDPEIQNAKRENVQHTRAALAMCENIDDNVGRLLDHLDHHNLETNTIVVYFSDNGPNGSRFNGGLRGRKGSVYEGGLRSPCLIRYPARIAAGHQVDQVGAAIDLLPTLADLAGIESKADRKSKPLDGTSLATALTKSSPSTADRLIFSAWKQKYSVRSQRFRYHLDGSLYEIDSDAGEQNDVSSKHPQVTARMKAALDAWISETHPSPAKAQADRPFPVGHPGSLWTQLPARDATASGTLQRSNRFPNCTFFGNWIDTDSTIRWNVNVLTAGTYQVQLFYACKQTDVGSTIELSLGDAVLSSRIDRANESPFLGGLHDRVPRQEGEVRDWRPMIMGQIDLPAGSAELTLRATEIAGNEVGEMRLLMLKRL